MNYTRGKSAAILVLAAAALFGSTRSAQAQFQYGYGTGLSNAERMLLFNRGLSNRNFQRYMFAAPAMNQPQFQQQQLYRQRIAQQQALSERQRIQSILTRPRTNVYTRTPAPAQTQRRPMMGPSEPEVPPEVLAVWDAFGALLQPADPAVVREVAPQYQAGMEVLGVRSGGAADRAGWKQGDVLLGLDRYRTESQDHVAFVAQLPSVLQGEPINALILRGDSVYSSELEPSPIQLPRD